MFFLYQPFPFFPVIWTLDSLFLPHASLRSSSLSCCLIFSFAVQTLISISIFNCTALLLQFLLVISYFEFILFHWVMSHSFNFSNCKCLLFHFFSSCLLFISSWTMVLVAALKSGKFLNLDYFSILLYSRQLRSYAVEIMSPLKSSMKCFCMRRKYLHLCPFRFSFVLLFSNFQVSILTPLWRHC